MTAICFELHTGNDRERLRECERLSQATPTLDCYASRCSFLTVAAIQYGLMRRTLRSHRCSSTQSMFYTVRLVTRRRPVWLPLRTSWQSLAAIPSELVCR